MPKLRVGKHVEETKGQVDRLVQVFTVLEERRKDKTCPAILGLVEEGKEVMEHFEDSTALDTGLLAGVQAVEHYEIARYRTFVAWAEQLGMQDAAKLLKQTLAEEEKTDKTPQRPGERHHHQQAKAA